MAGEKSDRRSQRIFRGVRLGFLVFFLVLATAAGILHQFAPVTKPVGVDALCPFGGIEAAFTLVMTGSLLPKIAWSSFILLAATIVVALVFRRVFCGKICAFGALQELFGRLGKAIFRKRLTVPAAIDKPARYLKYLTLAAIVILSAVAGQLIIRPYDPWAAWNHLLSVELISGFLVGLIILVVMSILHWSIDLGWNAFLGFAVNKSKGFDERAYLAVFGLCGIIMLVFGGWFLASALKTALGL